LWPIVPSSYSLGLLCFGNIPPNTLRKIWEVVMVNEIH
jgi:hypothetical protein